jgi:signal transduction histidine kinase
VDGDGAIQAAPVDALHAELAADPPAPRLAVPVLGPGGVLVGVLRVTTRQAAEPDPAQQAAVAALVRGIGAALRIAEAYLRLRDTQRELADAERITSLGAMAGGLAHEIKNPLLALKLGLHLLRREGGDTDRLARLASDVSRIDDLVTGLLRFTHDEVHEDAGPVDVPELVRGCVRELRPLADDRSAVIREAYPNVAAHVHATPTQLRLVVNNLVKNALDAVPDPGLVEVSVARVNGSVELRVGDNGPGIPPSRRGRLFDLSYSTKRGGSGIGLAVARREAERMGGSIHLETAPHDGTLMRVVLPHAPG